LLRCAAILDRPSHRHRRPPPPDAPHPDEPRAVPAPPDPSLLAPDDRHAAVPRAGHRLAPDVELARLRRIVVDLHLEVAGLREALEANPPVADAAALADETEAALALAEPALRVVEHLPAEARAAVAIVWTLARHTQRLADAGHAHPALERLGRRLAPGPVLDDPPDAGFAARDPGPRPGAPAGLPVDLGALLGGPPRRG
jgi:hypothetical protein